MRLLVVLLLGWLGLHPHGQEPRSVDPDLGALSCRVVKDVSERSGCRRLLVEVSNAAAIAAEPLEFRIEHRGKRGKSKQAGAATRVEIAPRASFPFAARRGRPVPPKGKTRYWLASFADANEAEVSIAVERATFFEGEGVPEPALQLGKLERIEQKSFDGTPLHVTRVRVVNPLEVPLDAVFLASTSEPRDETVLLGARLAPGVNDWVISEIVAGLHFAYDTPSQAVRVERLELVDWCLVDVPDAAAAARKLESPYRAWLGWSAPFPAVSGSLRCTVQSSSGAGEKVVEQLASGCFAIDAAGRARVEFEAAAEPRLDPETLRGLETTTARKVQDAFADLRRASFDELASRNRLRQVAGDAIEIDGPGFAPPDTPLSPGDHAKHDPLQTPNLTVRDGRIVADGDRSRFEGRTWTTRALGEGYVVTERRTPAGDWCYQYSYEFQDGVLVPSAYREYWGTVQGVLLQQFQAQFFDLRVERGGAAVLLPPPTGAGVDALRAAWGNGYRYPDSPRALSFAFEVRTPGTDLVWQNLRELEGRARLDSFRGYRMGRASWSGYEAEFETPMSDGQRRSLAFALFDRLVLWSGRDFNGRDDFAVQFAGCEVRAGDADGSFAILGGPLERVWLKDGRVAGLRWRGGLERRFGWTKVGDQLLVTRVTSGAEELTAKFASEGGVLLPTEFEFLRVFGADWGPERIRLRDLELR